MIGLVYEPPAIGTDGDPELLLWKYSIEIATMTNSPEPHLYNRAGKVILRDGTYSRRAATSRLHAMWLEAYHRYAQKGRYNPYLTAQVILWAENDPGTIISLRTKLSFSGAKEIGDWAKSVMPSDFLSHLNDDFGGLEEVCWLTVARELLLR